MDAHSRGQSLSGLGLRGFLLRRLQQLATIDETKLAPSRQLQGTFGAAPEAQLSFTDEPPVAGAVTTSGEVASSLRAEACCSDGMGRHGQCGYQSAQGRQEAAVTSPAQSPQGLLRPAPEA